MTIDTEQPTAMQQFWALHQQGLHEAGWGVREFATGLAPAVRGRRVLDVGCGAGYLSTHLAASGAVVTGVDFVPELLAVARASAATLPAGVTAPTFVHGNLLELDLGETFDCICGAAILHEIPAPHFPQLLDRLKRHLAPGGFCVFQENSYFNPVYRGLREHAVGRLGLRKVGSADERPFDEERWRLVQEAFTHSRRVCDVFVMFDRMWYQFLHPRVQRVSPSAASALGAACTTVDRLVQRHVGDSRLTRYWTWLQTIYFSDAVAFDDALGGEGRH